MAKRGDLREKRGTGTWALSFHRRSGKLSLSFYFWSGFWVPVSSPLSLRGNVKGEPTHVFLGARS